MDVGIACRVGLMAVLGMTLAARAEKDHDFKTGTTLENLQTAYDMESNDKAMYDAFALKAETEGFGKVASLFRAAARSDGIHAARLAKEITSLGGAPKAQIKGAAVGATKENLKAALDREDFERYSVYRPCAVRAEADGNKGALSIFKAAIATESQHAKYFKSAEAYPDYWKGGAKTFFVCRGCGFTDDESPAASCVVCAAPADQRDEVK